MNEAKDFDVVFKDPDAGYGPPYDSLTPSYRTDESKAKYVFHSDSDSFPGFLVSLKVR